MQSKLKKGETETGTGKMIIHELNSEITKLKQEVRKQRASEVEENDRKMVILQLEIDEVKAREAKWKENAEKQQKEFQ